MNWPKECCFESPSILKGFQQLENSNRKCRLRHTDCCYFQMLAYKREKNITVYIGIHITIASREHFLDTHPFLGFTGDSTNQTWSYIYTYICVIYIHTYVIYMFYIYILYILYIYNYYIYICYIFTYYTYYTFIIICSIHATPQVFFFFDRRHDRPWRRQDHPSSRDQVE